MTRVDFYILEQVETEGREHFACRLVEKAYQQGHKVYINAVDEPQARRMDELLWTFRAGSFIPHTCVAAEEDPDSRVHIGYGGDPLQHDDVLVNLAPEVPMFFSRFHRVAEIVDSNPEIREQGRIRFRFYRDRGYDLKSHGIANGQGNGGQAAG
jgi:DNA polymerase-3 subunit chi